VLYRCGLDGHKVILTQFYWELSWQLKKILFFFVHTSSIIEAKKLWGLQVQWLLNPTKTNLRQCQVWAHRSEGRRSPPPPIAAWLAGHSTDLSQAPGKTCSPAMCLPSSTVSPSGHVIQWPACGRRRKKMVTILCRWYIFPWVWKVINIACERAN